MQPPTQHPIHSHWQPSSGLFLLRTILVVPLTFDLASQPTCTLWCFTMTSVCLQRHQGWPLPLHNNNKKNPIYQSSRESLQKLFKKKKKGYLKTAVRAATRSACSSKRFPNAECRNKWSRLFWMLWFLKHFHQIHARNWHLVTYLLFANHLLLVYF